LLLGKRRGGGEGAREKEGNEHERKIHKIWISNREKKRL